MEIEGELKKDPAHLKDILDEHRLKVYSVTPANVDISHKDPAVQKEAVQYYLDLIPWAKTLEAERICIHGEVGKVRPSISLQNDWDSLVENTSIIVDKASHYQLPVVFEVLNRYENYQVINAKEALKLIEEIDDRNLSVLLDSYHMNIEEKFSPQAIAMVGERLGLYHIADSNREAMGNGQANLEEQLGSLQAIDYQGPIVMEMTAPGPDPFTPTKNQHSAEEVKHFYRHSLEKLRAWETIQIENGRYVQNFQNEE